MKIGMIGLGRMGLNMTERLINDGHLIVGYDLNKQSLKSAKMVGAITTKSLNELVDKIETPRTVWVMVPSGKATEEVVNTLNKLLKSGDCIIDGGNSYYKDSIRREKLSKQFSIDYLDCGTSGGIWGLKNGYCLTIGGLKKVYEKHKPIFKSLSPNKSNGKLHVGPIGAGHFVKMVHNGIEYGIMQAFAEGFELLESKTEFHLNLEAISENWRRGSVINSWLLDIIAEELEKEPSLSNLSSVVQDSGEGRWTVNESIELGVPAPVISAALYARFRSRQEDPLSGKILSAMRRGFGGHKSDDSTLK
ncbi:MAG: decarboxylating 6-phosphogluconate dehydrogenase [SAR202 cluster bacterium]|nr:decarboxylating 6-phosphogluconate dehydrogenase [Dehalococcoidia bacterium]MDP7612994.1 decarboxylating 6-phosphogluconate dehydrogenase [Dehalococcoidia bacterium]MQG47529.1 decarboxylating 6-phosphogluconate dehydrogenase [SAR202 cluster bacterium]